MGGTTGPSRTTGNGTANGPRGNQTHSPRTEPTPSRRNVDPGKDGYSPSREVAEERGRCKPKDEGVKETKSCPKPDQTPDPKGCEEKDTVKPEDKSEKGCKDRKDRKDCCKLDDLVDALKDLFEDWKKDNNCKPEKPPAGGGSGCGGGGGGGCGGAKGAGGCGGAGSSQGAGDGDQGVDPIEELTIALQAVEKARCPRAKAEAVEELKEVYSEVKEMGVEIPKKLERRVRAALGQGGCGAGNPDRQGEDSRADRARASDRGDRGPRRTEELQRAA